MNLFKMSRWMVTGLACLALVSMVLGVAAPQLAAQDAKVGFEIGNQAPEIQGEDIDGVKFKLSDYRGKVVVLDFWGDW